MDMRTMMTGMALGAAVISSIATSPAPGPRWVVYGSDRASVAMDRDTDVQLLAIDVEVNETAMGFLDLQGPSIDPVPVGQVPELFSATLDVDVRAVTRGITGIGANDTGIEVTLMHEDGTLIETFSGDLLAFEPLRFELMAPSVLAHCRTVDTCEDAFLVEVHTDTRSRVRLGVEAHVRLDGWVNVDKADGSRIRVHVDPL